jgi:hypothetical protein
MPYAIQQGSIMAVDRTQLQHYSTTGNVARADAAHGSLHLSGCIASTAAAALCAFKTPLALLPAASKCTVVFHCAMLMT